MAENVLKKAESWAAGQPWYTWAGALTGGGLVLWYVIRARAKSAASKTTAASSASSASGQNSTLNGYDVASLAGVPYGYVDAGYNSGGYSYGNGPTDNFTGNLPKPATYSGYVRGKGVAGNYDNTHPGVPYTDAPGGKVLGYIPFSAPVAISGDPVVGPNSPQNTNTYYKVTYGSQSGYLSSFDLPSVYQSTGVGGGGKPSDWKTALNLGRNTIDQHAQNFALLN